MPLAPRNKSKVYKVPKRPYEAPRYVESTASTSSRYLNLLYSLDAELRQVSLQRLTNFA